MVVTWDWKGGAGGALEVMEKNDQSPSGGVSLKVEVVMRLSPLGSNWGLTVSEGEDIVGSGLPGESH